MRKKRFDNLDSIMQFGSPMNCRFSFGGGGGPVQQAPADNSAEMMRMFQQQAREQEARFAAMESARMETMMEMEKMRLEHESKLREQIKRADMEAERLLREEVTTSSEEAEAVAVQQDVETPEGISIDFMAALQAGMQDLYPE